MDKIIVRNLELSLRIGCEARERAAPQRILIDIEAGVDARRSASSRQLNDTVCYRELSQLVRELSEGQEWVLLEELAETLVTRIFTLFPAARDLTLTVKKFVIPGAEWTGLVMQRARA